MTEKIRQTDITKNRSRTLAISYSAVPSFDCQEHVFFFPSRLTDFVKPSRVLCAHANFTQSLKIYALLA